jgi:hypothetical protein
MALVRRWTWRWYSALEHALTPGFLQVQAEQGGDVVWLEDPPRIERPVREGERFVEICQQVVGVHGTQPEQKLWLLVEPGTDAIERCGDVFAHRSPVRAGAGEPNFRRLGEQAIILAAEPLHHTPGKPPLQQLDK